MEWLIKFKRRKHESTFLATLEETRRFKEFVNQQPCPACGQRGNSLQLEKFVRNPEGWDAEISCTNCTFRGIVNSLGLDFKELHGRGKARS
jgi:DNA-directed RNA polymerase subunit RPC12/RpoP